MCSLQWRSLYPAILNVEFSEIETRSAKNYRMSVGDMTSAKSLSPFISTCFCSSICNLINIDRPRLMEANTRQLNNFEQNIAKFKRNLIDRGYPEMLIQERLSEVKFENRNAALTPKPKENKRILPFVTQYQLSVPNIKQILMKNWYLLEQPRLKKIFKESPIISCTRGRSLKDILVSAKL